MKLGQLHRDWFAFLVICFSMLGCSSDPTQAQADPAEQNLLSIHSAYEQAVSSGRAPRGPKDLRRGLGDGEKGDLEQMLRSPRDHQPYEIIWGVMLNSDEENPRVLAYEKNGADGTRFVLWTDGAVKKMTEPEFKKARRAVPN